jgi:transglutaminase-like putative cysteine protease
VLKPSGESVEAAGREDRDLSEPRDALYYDVRAEGVRFERLEAGDVVDFEYVISDIGAHNLFADAFGDLHPLGEASPRDETVYALVIPRSRSIYFNEPKLPGLERHERTVGDERIYEWRATHVPKVEIEPGMPGWSETTPTLHVSTYRTWAEAADWYWGLVSRELVSDAAMEDAAARAVAGLSNERDRVAAIHDLVVGGTRYVGLEFGIHGWRPYRTTQVFARRFGDCKDKAALLVVLLRAIGVQASLALVRTRRGGDIPSFPASVAVFDHAVAYVPSQDLWLDGTAEYAGAEELPPQDQGVLALRIDAGHGGALVRIPILPAARNRVLRDEHIRISTDGSARIAESLTLFGQAAPAWREHYQADGERADRYEKAWSARLPGARLVTVEMPGIGDRRRPVEVRAQVEVSRMLRAGGAGFLLLPTGHETELLRSYAPLSARSQELLLEYPWRQEERYEVELPERWSVHAAPPERAIESPFGSLHTKVEATGARLTLSFQLEIAQSRIARADYPAFRRFLADVDAALSRDFEVGP